MKEKEKKVTSIPEWIGKYPFSPEEKKPVTITKNMELSTLYGFQGTQVESQIFVSTDKITFSDWTLPPGARIEPPGLHNVAPRIWAEDAMGTRIPIVKKPKFYKGQQENQE